MSNSTNKKVWPTKDAMAQIYELNLWGGLPGSYYSGEGSHADYIVEPYLKVVKDFLAKHNKSLSVCDLGCGDFNIGRQLLNYTECYVGVDIVPDLILHNQKSFQHPVLSFQCIDIAKDELPIGDCVILRQVLQHLSNAEVLNVVSKLSQYKYVLLTEHIPNGNFVPNADIISGQGIRIKKQSGLDLLKPPFNLKVTKVEELLAIHVTKGKVITWLFTI